MWFDLPGKICKKYFLANPNSSFHIKLEPFKLPYSYPEVDIQHCVCYVCHSLRRSLLVWETWELKPLTKKQAAGTRHLCSCCTSCCTFLCFSLRKKVCLIKDAGPQVGVCQSMDLPTYSVQTHGTLCTQLSTINASPASFHFTSLAGASKQ